VAIVIDDELNFDLIQKKTKKKMQKNYGLLKNCQKMNINSITKKN